MPKKDLILQSEYIEIISLILKQEFSVPVIISQFHEIKVGDGNSLFYIITRDGFRYMVNIMGLNPKDNSLLYWVESIDHAGKVCEFFYDQDLFIITFQRGEKYNHEFLVYLYFVGNKFPAIRFIPGKIYRSYSRMLSRYYRKYPFVLPAELRVATGF